MPLESEAVVGGSNKQEPPTPPEVNPQERRRSIAHLGRMFTRRYDMEVIPSGQKGVWACSLDPKVTPEIEKYIEGKRQTLSDLPEESFRPKQILYDEESAMEMGMDEIIPILRHEAGHAKYTDFRIMFEGQKQAKDEKYLPTSYWMIYEGLEDPRVNNREGEESPAIDKQIRDFHINEIGKRLSEKSIREMPLPVQFTFNSIHHWLYEEGIPELKDTEVGRLYETTKPLLDRYFQSTNTEEQRTLAKSIWDIAKVLEKKELEQEEMRQTAKQKGMKGQGFGEQQPGQSQTPSEERLDLSKLTPKQVQEIKDAIEKLTPKERVELAKKAKEIVDELQKRELEKRMSKTFKLQKDKKTGKYQVVPNMSNSRTQEKARENYQGIAQRVEAEEQEEFTRQEQERLLQEEIQKKLDEQRRQQLELKKAGFNENEREKFLLYQSLEDAMYPYVRRFKDTIEKIVPRKKEMTFEGGHFSGPKFDRRALVRKAPVGDESFHMRPIDRPTGEPKLFIGLLVDNSGSMSGQKIDEARKTMIFFAKACNDLGIPFMMSAFGNNTDVVKNFRQDFENPGERVKPKLIESTDASGGGTNIYDGVKTTIEAMNEQRRKLHDSHGLIFVISDGEANVSLTGRELKNYIDENRGRLTFKAFGLSSNQSERQQIQSHLNMYFGEGNCAYPGNFEDLPDEAYRILRVNLMQFQRFLT